MSMTSALAAQCRARPPLLGTVAGLLPTLLAALAVPIVPEALSMPVMAAAYLCYMALAFPATACLVRPDRRPLGAGMALGLLITTALYVVVLFGASGSFS